jgi:hypothetical protein
MRCHRPIAVFIVVLASTMIGWCGAGRAEPVVNGGIGLANCGKLVADLKPDDGVNHLPNGLLFYWVQGYVSAANVYLLNEYNNYVDLNGVDDKQILRLVADFCKANPDQKPVAAIDNYIREAKKIKVKEDDAFDPWGQ